MELISRKLVFGKKIMKSKFSRFFFSLFFQLIKKLKIIYFVEVLFFLGLMKIKESILTVLKGIAMGGADVIP